MLCGHNQENMQKHGNNQAEECVVNAATTLQRVPSDDGSSSDHSEQLNMEPLGVHYMIKQLALSLQQRKQANNLVKWN